MLKSRRGQADIIGLLKFAITLLVVGIVVVVAFIILGSFSSILTANNEITAAANTSMGDVNGALQVISFFISYPVLDIIIFIIAILLYLILSSKIQDTHRVSED